MDDATEAARAAAAELKQRIAKLDENGLDLIFRQARTFRAWQDRDIDDATLERLFELLRLAPTSGNCCPGRFVFVKSPEAKERLKPALDSYNVKKTMSAPVCTIVAYDLAFYGDLDWLSPHAKGAAEEFRADAALAETTAFRSGSLQGAYLILAARALGLDCGPMSGFDNAKVDQTFFAGTGLRSNFLCNLGYGDPQNLHPRAARHSFEQACQIL